MMKIERMFRTCGPGRSPPTGTLTILSHGDGRFRLIAVADSGDREELDIGKFEVVMPEPKVEPTGRVIVAERSRTWHFFRELPVSAERIIQTVAVLGAGPKVKVVS